MASCVNALADIGAMGLLVGAALMLARALPAQNVALILGCLLICEIPLEARWSGPDALGRGLLFWPAMVVWARVGARWILRRGRRDWNYGMWLMVLASTVTALAQFVMALPGANGFAALKLSAIRLGASGFCLFWLSPWFISKLPQQPQDHAH